MPLRLLLDENARGILWQAIQQHNGHSMWQIDAMRVGDPPGLPRGSADPDILVWCEREDRLLVIYDVNTMVAHWRDHLERGGNSPGLLLVRDRADIGEVVDVLVLIAYASDSLDWRNRVDWVPW